MDAVHAWAYLPGMARAILDLAALMQAVARTTHSPLRHRRFPWPLLRMVAPCNPLMRAVLEMRCLRDKPHRLDPAPLGVVLPAFAPTPLAQALNHVGCTAQTQVRAA